MVKILVTGGAGFIGSSLVNYLIKNCNYKVIVVDNLITGNIKNIDNSSIKIIKKDINDYYELKKIFKLHRFDYVFHFAALVGVKRTQQNPLDVLKDIKGFQNIFELSSLYKVQRLFYSSSSEVYGEPVTIPQNEETTPLNSRIPYAIVKNLGESFCKTYFKEKKLQYTIFRFFNTYGKTQSNDFVISKFVNLAKKNKTINIYGDGEQRRTFCYIDDTIEAVVKCFEKNLHINDVVNIGNNLEITMNNLAQIIIKKTNSKSKIKYIKALEEGDMKRRKPDNLKMKKILNRKLVSLSNGLNKII